MGNILCKINSVKPLFYSIFQKTFNVFYIFKKNKNVEKNEINNEKNKVRSNFFIRSIKEMNRYELMLISTALIFLGINAYTNLNFPKIMGECVESNVNFNESKLITYIEKISILNKLKLNNSIYVIFKYFPYFMFGGIASYFRIYFTNKCINNIEYRMQKQLHNKILNDNSLEFQKYKSSDYLVNCTFNEIKYSSKEIVTTITQMLRYLNSIIGGIISMISISSYLTKLCVLIIPTYGFVVLKILKKINNLKTETSDINDKQMERFSDILQKKNIITLFGNEYYENEYFSKSIDYYDKLKYKSIKTESLFHSFLNLGTNIVICSILCFGKMELKKNNITHGQLISFIAYSSMLGLGIVGMLKLKKELNILQISLEKIYKILDYPESDKKKKENELLNKNTYDDKIQENEKKKNLSINNNTKELLNEYEINNTLLNSINDIKILCPDNIKGNIKFENLYFRYNVDYVLKNINLEIKENEKVAIIGKSGSGKSSLWKLLTQEYKYEGNIYIDNYNFKDINKTYFKKILLSICEQECTILNRSLYENLIYALLPIKILNKEKIPNIIFDNIDPKNYIYQKIISYNNEYNIINENKENKLTKDNISFILQNYDFNDKKYGYLKEKIEMNMNSLIDDNILTVKEKKFINNIIKQLRKKIKNKTKFNNSNKNESYLFNSKKYTKDNQIDNNNNNNNINDNGININTFLKNYEHQLNTIKASIQVMCDELDLNTLINTHSYNILKTVQNNSISLGQKQRIAIIRSLMKNASIYIFDEITASLDESNAEKVFKIIDSLIPNKTIIYITHSKKILDKMDKIIIIDNGEIKKIGTYDEIKNTELFLNIFPKQKNKI